MDRPKESCLTAVFPALGRNPQQLCPERGFSINKVLAKSPPIVGADSFVLLFERHDDFEKSRVLGKVFARYVRGQLDYETFLKIAKAIELSFIGDLNRLPEYYSRIQSYDPKLGKPFTDWVDDQTCQSLYASGLVYSEGWSENTYHPNSVGQELVRCLKE